MEAATELFEDTMGWLKENYSSFKFFVERDIVWTVQTHIAKMIEEWRLPYKVFNDYPMLPANRRSLSTDIAIINLNSSGLVDVAVEFKFEPSHSRNDILQTKFPVVVWGKDGVGKDVERIKEFVDIGKAKVAYVVFIDEGRHFRHRVPHSGSDWIDWKMKGSSNEISVLWSRVGANS